MVFCSFPYIVFLALVLTALRLLESRPRLQHTVLLASSSFFYGYWDWRFLGLLWLSAMTDFIVAIGMERFPTPRAKKTLLCISIFGNMGQLCFFKYFDFFQTSAERLLSSAGIDYEPWLLEWILPVGISFYTFQTLCYTIDVYRGKLPACRDLLLFGNYVCYFPQLVAGPIERAPHLLPQLARVKLVRLGNVLSGGLMIVWGSFKKAVVADIAGLYLADPIFAGPQGGLELWLGVFAFAIQIYCDFSGYCDIARGTSRCMGIELVENFNAPYFATNITDFWRRWHMSLSSWLRDYVYISLGGNRRGRARTYLNLWITMFLCGLWHGANVTFVLWGIYHGVLLLLHRAWRGEERKQAPSGRTAATVFYACATFILVNFGWMLFRAKDGEQMMEYAVLLLDVTSWKITPETPGICATLLILSIPLAASHLFQLKDNREGSRLETALPFPAPLAGALAGLIIVLTLVFGTFAENLPFIYFQF